MQKRGALRGIEPHVRHGTKMVGRALTVRTANGDWAKPVEAIDRAKPGDVIVIDAGGGSTAAWGELASHSCQVKGAAALPLRGRPPSRRPRPARHLPPVPRRRAPHTGGARWPG